MVANGTRVYRLGEFHRFEAAGAQLPLSGAGRRDFRSRRRRRKADRLPDSRANCRTTDLSQDLAASGLSIEDAEELIEEMVHANVIVAARLRSGAAARRFPTFFPFRRW